MLTVYNRAVEEVKKKIFNRMQKCINRTAVALLSMRPEMSIEEKVYILEFLPMYNRTKYIKKMLVEILQGAYEHFHFVLGPFPKSIELYRQKGTISHTPIPIKSVGWRGRLILVPGDTITAYYIYTKGFTVIEDAKRALNKIFSGHISEVDTYLTVIASLMMLGSCVYYFVIKVADMKQATKQLRQNTTTLTNIN